MPKISEKTIVILSVLFSICFVSLLLFLSRTIEAPAKSQVVVTTPTPTRPVAPTATEAVNLVQNLPEVVTYIKTVPHAVVEYDHDTDDKSAWVIHVYENREDHLATFNWFDVDKKTQKITKEFDF